MHKFEKVIFCCKYGEMKLSRVENCESTFSLIFNNFAFPVSAILMLKYTFKKG
jgi:hypothetical protein